MTLSQLARSIKESPTLKLNETAAKLRAKGEPLIHLGGGEPKSKAPIDAVIHCANQLHSGEVRYAPADGLPDLKKAVIRYHEEHYGKMVTPENVVCSSGAKQAIMVFLHAILADRATGLAMSAGHTVIVGPTGAEVLSRRPLAYHVCR